jgi:hypothetical protein
VTASPTSPTSSSGRPSARRTAGQRPTGSRGALRRPASGESASRGVSGKRRATVLRPSRPDSLRPHCLLAPADPGRTADRLTTAQKVTSSRTVAHRRIGIGTLAGARNANGPRMIPGDRWGTEERPALTARQPSEHEKPWNFQGFSRAADGTRTHDLLHGNRLGNPHKRLVLRVLAESDYRGLPAIRWLLVPQWSPGVRVGSTASRHQDRHRPGLAGPPSSARRRPDRWRPQRRRRGRARVAARSRGRGRCRLLPSRALGPNGTVAGRRRGGPRERSLDHRRRSRSGCRR